MFRFSLPVSPSGRERSRAALRAKLAWYSQWLQQRRGRFGARTAFVFVLLPTAHEYGWPRFTQPRHAAYNAVARRALAGSGWALLDFERMSAARPDLRSVYALSFANFTGGVEYSLANAALNIACS